MVEWSAYYTVAAAAEELGVSEGRVRGLIESNVLAADKVAGRWLIAPDSVHARKINQRRPGRPISSTVLWDMINSGFIAELLLGADAAARHNIRVQLATRAKVHDVYVLPQRLPRSVKPVLAPGGRELAESAGVPAGRDLRFRTDAYIEAATFKEMRRKKVVSGVRGGDPNVRLRVVEQGNMTWRESQAGRLLVAWLDLADAGDRAADLVLTSLMDELRRAEIQRFEVGNRILATASLGALASLHGDVVGSARR